LCCEKAYSVKEFFYNYSIHHGNVEINLKNQTIKSLNSDIEDWNISVIDVGKNSYSGGALKKAREVIGNEPFMYTYGDGLSNIDLDLLLSHHIRHKKMITISSITASQKFGVIDFNDNGSVVGFREKDNLDSVVNGGFMVFNPEVFDLIDDDPKTVFEKEPMVTAVACHQVTAYRHKGFWRSLDSYEDLEEFREQSDCKWIDINGNTLKPVDGSRDFSLWNENLEMTRRSKRELRENMKSINNVKPQVINHHSSGASNNYGGQIDGYVNSPAVINPNTPTEDNTRWEQHYKSTYAKYENRVIDLFNTLNTLHTTSNGGATSSYAISETKASIRNIQSEMKRVRNEAQQQNVYISVSSWETASY
jgi:glucose-1-phosphate cytidylyltransferase